MQAARRTLHVPTPMLRDMQKQAARLDRDVSWCIHMAWNMAADHVQHWSADDASPASRLLQGRRRRQTVALPGDTWHELTHEAARLDRSLSWLVQQSWLSARPRFLRAAR